MWHKADLIGHPMRLELTLAGLLVKLAYHYTTRGAQYLDLAREMKKKTMEHGGDRDINCCWCTCYCHQMIATRTGGLGNKRTSGDHPNKGIIKIGQNTEKSPGLFRRLAVTQTPVKKHNKILVQLHCFFFFSFFYKKYITLFFSVFHTRSNRKYYLPDFEHPLNLCFLSWVSAGYLGTKNPKVLTL